jgi:hypothetical protein
VAATIIMCAVTCLMATNTQLLTGLPAGDPVNTTLLVVAPLLFAAGTVLALVLRKANPAAYQRIGHSE